MKISEKDIDNLIVCNILRNSAFRDWVIIKFTKLPVFPYELLEARRSVRVSGLGETDIFFKIKILNPDWSENIKFLWEKKCLSSYKNHPNLE